jgi:hypothetical protein
VEGEIPTLGYEAIDWMSSMLLEPSTSFVKPFIPTLEQEDFLLRWFALDPKTGAFVNRTGLLQRPRGWGKSPFLAALCVFENLKTVRKLMST